MENIRCPGNLPSGTTFGTIWPELPSAVQKGTEPPVSGELVWNKTNSNKTIPKSNINRSTKGCRTAFAQVSMVNVRYAVDVTCFDRLSRGLRRIGLEHCRHHSESFPKTCGWWNAQHSKMALVECFPSWDISTNLCTLIKDSNSFLGFEEACFFVWSFQYRKN